MAISERQHPNRPRPAAKSARGGTGGILDGAIDVSDLESDYLRMCIYGENRVGKTTLACQFPKPLLLVAMEPSLTGGALSVRKVDGVKYLRITKSETFLKLAQELPGSGFKTVVIDSATTLQDVILAELLGLDKPVDMNQWGLASQDNYRDRSGKTRECLRPYLDLPMHVVITAKQRDHNRQPDEKSKALSNVQAQSFFAADLGGATAKWLNDASDYICRLFVEEEEKTVIRKSGIKGKKGYKEWASKVPTGKFIRRLQTMYHPNYAAGFRSDNPEAVPFYINRPTYDRIAAVINGEIIEDAEYVDDSQIPPEEAEESVISE